jgi:sulfhydrogenase subunit beta (sulfur reductase)
MERRVLRKESLPAALTRLAEQFVVAGPVSEEGNVLFAPLGGREAHLPFANTRNAPKNTLFPHTEALVRFLRTPRGVEVVGEGDEVRETVVLVRPCDARSFLFLDRVFDQEQWKDPYYRARREHTTVVSLACAKPPYAACFCTSVGGEPVTGEGADVLITDLGEGLLAEFLTEKGEKLAACFAGEPARETEVARKEEVRASARTAIRSNVPAAEVKPILEANFEHPFWDGLHKSCLACGTCTYLCPTCHCFDISDEATDERGVRIRNWDSCMYPLFTKETSGHNPRSSQKERWRQRAMHKFRYIPANFGLVGCVGCGRCVLNCPVNLDIRKIVRDVSEL